MTTSTSSSRSLSEVEVSLRTSQARLRTDSLALASEVRALAYAVSPDGLQEASAHKLRTLVAGSGERSGWRANLTSLAQSAIDFFLPATPPQGPAEQTAVDAAR